MSRKNSEIVNQLRDSVMGSMLSGSKEEMMSSAIEILTISRSISQLLNLLPTDELIAQMEKDRVTKPVAPVIKMQIEALTSLEERVARELNSPGVLSYLIQVANELAEERGGNHDDEW